MNYEKAAGSLTASVKDIATITNAMIPFDRPEHGKIQMALGRIEGIAMMLAGMKDSGPPARREKG